VKIQKKSFKVVLCLLLIVFLTVALFPIYWTFITSIKSSEEIFAIVPTFFPRNLVWSGYSTLFLKTRFVKNLMNSMFVSLTVSTMSILVSMLAAYAIARIYFRGRKVISKGIFYAYLMPKTVLFIPVYILVTSIGLADSIWCLVFIYPSITIPYATWMLVSYFKSIPYDIEEAAIVDGCGRLGSMFKIVFPLAMPGIISTFIFSFTICWSEYLYALVIITKNSQKTVSLGLADMIVGDLVNWGPLMGGAIIASLPIVILYLVASKYLINNMVAGGVKQ